MTERTTVGAYLRRYTNGEAVITLTPSFLPGECFVSVSIPADTRIEKGFGGQLLLYPAGQVRGMELLEAFNCGLAVPTDPKAFKGE